MNRIGPSVWSSIAAPFFAIKQKCCEALEQAAQGSGGVTIPGGVQKTCRYVTSGHGLAGMVVLG